MSIVKGLEAIAIHTTDIENSIKFYTELLGFQLFYQHVIPDGPNKGMTCAYVRVGSCNIALVKPPYEGYENYVKIPCENGDHFELNVLGIDELIQKIKAAGYKFESDEILYAENIFPAGHSANFFTGPNHERIGLIEYGYRK